MFALEPFWLVKVVLIITYVCMMLLQWEIFIGPKKVGSIRLVWGNQLG